MVKLVIAQALAGETVRSHNLTLDALSGLHGWADGGGRRRADTCLGAAVRPFATVRTQTVFHTQMSLTPKRIRFGLLLEQFSGPADLIATARRAEAAGFSTLLIRDHFIAEPFGVQFAPFSTLAVVAAATQTLRIGTLVLDNDYRHPVVVAKEAATLDLLSDGRFELGLGAGWARDEYARAGIAFDPAGVRIDRLAESVSMLKSLFGPDPTTFDGQHYQVRDLTSFPTPRQRPHPPILIGAGGQRMLSLAARTADIIAIMSAPITSGTLPDDPRSQLESNIAQRVDWVRAAAGERFAELELALVVSLRPAPDRAAAADAISRQPGWAGISAQNVLDMPRYLIGSLAQMVADLVRRRERLGLSYVIVTDRDMAAAVPLIEQLRGAGRAVSPLT